MAEYDTKEIEKELQYQDDATQFEPFVGKGRTFCEKGSWMFVMSGGMEMFVKLTEDQYLAALRGLPFEAYHPMSVSPGQPPIFLPQMFATVGSWTMNGALCAAWSKIHPKIAAGLDSQIKKAFSMIDLPTAGEKKAVEATAGKSKLHLA